jgi:hypothetical protein
LALDAGERSAKAEVSRPTECEMPVVRASKVQPIRIREPLRIAIRRAHDRNDCIPFADLTAPEFKIRAS